MALAWPVLSSKVFHSPTGQFASAANAAGGPAAAASMQPKNAIRMDLDMPLNIHRRAPRRRPAGRCPARRRGRRRGWRARSDADRRRSLGEKRRQSRCVERSQHIAHLQRKTREDAICVHRSIIISHITAHRPMASHLQVAHFGEFVHTKLSLTEGSIPRALLAFALPILFGNVLQSVNGSVNAVWVGKYLGEAAFAAVGNANVVMFLMFGVMFGFTMAATVMVAQCVGANFLAFPFMGGLFFIMAVSSMVAQNVGA